MGTTAATIASTSAITCGRWTDELPRKTRPAHSRLPFCAEVAMNSVNEGFVWTALAVGTGMITVVWLSALLVRRSRNLPERVLFLGNGPLVVGLAEEVAADGRRFRI